MAVTGAVTLGRARAQEPDPPPIAPDPVVDSAPAAALAPLEEAGPAPGSPTIGLAAAVRMALERNFSLRGSSDDLQAARLRHAAARAEFYPKLTPRFDRFEAGNSVLELKGQQKLPWTGGTVAVRGELRSQALPDTPLTRGSELRVELTQPLLRGFGPTAAFYELTSSRRRKEGQERAYELDRQRLAVEVSSTFYQVLQQRALVSVSRQSLRRSESLEKASRARLEVGLVSKLDVFRAQLQAAQAREALLRAQSSLETALERFRLLLGLAATDALEPEAAALPEDLTDDLEPVDVLVARALSRRLDLAEQRDTVGDARRTASVARQSLLPQLDLRLGLVDRGFGPSYGDAWRRADRQYQFAFSTSYPLERATDLASKAVAELEVASRERALRSRELAVEAEVRAAVRELAQVRQSVELQRQAVEVAEQQHRLATLRYQRGLASNFDVVEAEESLVLARSALVSLLARYQVSRVDLLRLVGTLDVQQEFAP
jgi:outer membrane protein TolC